MEKSNTALCQRTYLAPEVKVVRFLVELGYDVSTTLTVPTTPYEMSPNSGDNFFGGNSDNGVTTGDYTLRDDWGWNLNN